MIRFERCIPALVAWALSWSAACSPGDQASLATRHRPIIGGHAERGYPAVGALVEQGEEFCTGTLISPTVILTAAHCLVDTDPRDVGFVLDSHLGRHERGLAVASLHPHPSYVDTDDSEGSDGPDAQAAVEYDIGVVILERASDVAPMAIQREPLSPSWEGRNLRHVGFGIASPSSQVANQKRSVDVPLSRLWPTTYTSNSGRNNTCDGDSGSPAIDLDGAGAIIGVTSWGDDQCARFGVDTRVDSFLDFLDSYLPSDGALSG